MVFYLNNSVTSVLLFKNNVVLIYEQRDSAASGSVWAVEGNLAVGLHPFFLPSPSKEANALAENLHEGAYAKERARACLLPEPR